LVYCTGDPENTGEREFLTHSMDINKIKLLHIRMEANYLGKGAIATST